MARSAAEADDLVVAALGSNYRPARVSCCWIILRFEDGRIVPGPLAQRHGGDKALDRAVEDVRALIAKG